MLLGEMGVSVLWSELLPGMAAPAPLTVQATSNSGRIACSMSTCVGKPGSSTAGFAATSSTCTPKMDNSTYLSASPYEQVHERWITKYKCNDSKGACAHMYSQQCSSTAKQQHSLMGRHSCAAMCAGATCAACDGPVRNNIFAVAWSRLNPSFECLE